MHAGPGLHIGACAPAGMGATHRATVPTAPALLHAACAPMQVQLTFEAAPQGGKSFTFRAWARNNVAWSTGSLPALPVTLPPKVWAAGRWA